MNINLIGHNKDSYKNAIKLFKKHNRVCIEQATSTGKSYVIAKIISNPKFKKVLLLAPSNYILNQFKEKFPDLYKEVGVLDYVTYSKTLYFSKEEISGLDYDLIILDEYHRLGAKKWGKCVNEILEACPNAKVFGATATPVRFSDNGRNMSEEIFEGIIANKITLEDALNKSILAKPKYVIGMYDIGEDERRLKSKLKSSTVENVEEIKENIKYLVNNFNKTKGISDILKKYIFDERKFIIFCESIKHLNEVKQSVNEWFFHAFNEYPFIYEAHSSMSGSIDQFEKFKNADRKKFSLLLVVNMLNEGVHIKDIDGIIMLRSTESANIYYQQLGRGLVLNNKRPTLIFDFVKNSKVISNPNYSFDSVKNYKEGEKRKDYEYKDYKLEVYFDVYDETIDIVKAINGIDSSLSYWDINFKDLVEFKNANGHLRVPKSNKKLYKFKARQIYLYNNNKLPQEKIDLLNSIGIVWDFLEDLWNERYEELIDFKTKFGHLIVPENGEYKVLATWVKTQKKRKRIGKLTPYREKLLLDIGINFSKSRLEREEEVWNMKFELLKEYKKIHGHCNVSSRDKENRILANWCHHQRAMNKAERISEHRKKLLLDLGFKFGREQEK